MGATKELADKNNNHFAREVTSKGATSLQAIEIPLLANQEEQLMIHSALPLRVVSIEAKA